MKDLTQAFNESFQKMQRLIDEDNLLGSSNLSTDLIRASVLQDFKDGILVAEVLESIFTQVDPITKIYMVNEDDWKSVREKMKALIGSVAQSYNKEDKKELYEALKEFRSLATDLQFRAYNTMKYKPEVEGRYTPRREVDW